MKRKSSADLLLASGDGATGGYSSSTLDRISGLAAGVMMTSSTTSSQLTKAEKKKLEKMKENMKQLLGKMAHMETRSPGQSAATVGWGGVGWGRGGLAIC